MATGVDPWTSQNAFEIEFLDHCSWRLSCGDHVLLMSIYGAPSLPREKFPKNRLLDTYQRLFPEANQEDVDRFLSIFDAATGQRHGSMLIVAEDAEFEADRLREQGTKIKPTKLTSDLYQQVSGIDGAVIVDPHGVCYAIGAIIDGVASPQCTPSRGARYNSGIRYIVWGLPLKVDNGV
ncbi:MAG: diadenylate cyclase [Rhodospirillales bacterium]|nr:diadenylate cyclase [Rhodospirillales bacterium]